MKAICAYVYNEYHELFKKRNFFITLHVNIITFSAMRYNLKLRKRIRSAEIMYYY